MRRAVNTQYLISSFCCRESGDKSPRGNCSTCDSRPEPGVIEHGLDGVERGPHAEAAGVAADADDRRGSERPAEPTEHGQVFNPATRRCQLYHSHDDDDGERRHDDEDDDSHNDDGVAIAQRQPGSAALARG